MGLFLRWLLSVVVAVLCDGKSSNRKTLSKCVRLHKADDICILNRVDL